MCVTLGSSSAVREEERRKLKDVYRLLGVKSSDCEE